MKIKTLIVTCATLFLVSSQIGFAANNSKFIRCPGGADVQKNLELDYFSGVYRNGMMRSPLYKGYMDVEGNEAYIEVNLDLPKENETQDKFFVNLYSYPVASVADKDDQAKEALLICRYTVLKANPAFISSSTWAYDQEVPKDRSFANLLIRISNAKCSAIGVSDFSCDPI